VFDQFGYGSGSGGGPRQHGGSTAQPARVSQRAADDRNALTPDTEETPRVFVVGGNSSTLAFVNSFVAQGGAITARMLPVAVTPAGAVIGDTWQNAGIALAHLFDWVDRTFPPEDERAFVVPGRDIELLARTGWHAPLPETITERTVLNIEDVPDELADALALPPAPVVQCAACRRLCVRDEFVWKEKQLCAWDYHAQVFGRRGPWRTGPYEDRHFETLPQASYVAPTLLAETGVELVMMFNAVDEATARAAINVVLAGDGERSHMAVRTTGGFSVLREPSRDA